MNDAAVEDALRTYLVNNWTLTDLAGDQWGDFYKPIEGRPYLRPILVLENEAGVGKAGDTNFYRFETLLQLELRVPLQTPAATKKTLRDAVTALFRAKTVTNVGRFRVPSLSTGHGLRDGSWIIYGYDVWFLRDEYEVVT